MSMSPQMNSSFNSTLYGNFSLARKTPPWWNINYPEVYRISFIICYALILILSVLGNTSIIAIVARNPSMRSTINYLIANMAATDLVTTVVVTGRFFSVLHTFSWEWQISGVFGDILCKFIPFVRDVSLLVSFHSIIAIALDRFFAVLFPMRATPRFLTTRVLLPAIWIEAISIFSVYSIRYRVIHTKMVNICYAVWPRGFDRYKSEKIFILMFLIFAYVVPFVIISILYSVIASHMKRQNIPGTQSQENEEKRRQLNKRIVKMSYTIVMSFFACWTPYQITHLLNIFKWRGKIPPELVIPIDIFILISYSSLAIDPLICFLFCSNYRNYFRKLFPILFVSKVEPLDLRRKRDSRRLRHTEMFVLNSLRLAVENEEISTIQ